MAGTNVGSLFVEIGAKIDGLKKGLSEAEKLMNKTGATAKNMGTGVTSGMNQVSSAINVVGLIAKSLVTAKAIDMVADGMVSMVNSARAWGDTIDTMGDQFGMSGEEASKWAVAMQHVGVSVQDGAMQLNYFTRMLAEAGTDGTSGFAQAMDRLGVSTHDAQGRVRSFNELMPEIMDAFQRLPAGIDASAIAMEMFGARGGTKFLDFLRQGSAGLDEASEKAKQFGLVLDTIESDKIEQLSFKVNDLGMAFEGVKVSIGIGLLGPLDGAIDLLNQVASGLGVLTGGDALEKWNAIVEYGLYGRQTDYLRRQLTPQPGTYTGVGAVRAADAANLSANFGDPNARWYAMAGGLTAQAKAEDEVRRMRAIIQGVGGGGASALSGASVGGYGGASSAAATSLGFNDYLASAFANPGAAMGWMGAYSAEHGGRAATQVDLRDKMAGDLFAQKYGRAATQSEWEGRYYSGSFAGMEGEEDELSKLFGPSGTLASKLDEQRRQDKESFDKLLAAFEAAEDKTYTVKIEGRLTD